MSNKTWTVLQICCGVAIVVIVILGFTVFGEQQDDGSFVAVRNPFTIFLGFFSLFCGFFLVLAHFRKRTGELTLKTFLLTALWYGCIALLLSVTSYLRH